MNNVYLAGCVILYKPNLDTITNVESYIDYVKTLFIVNNGDGSNVINALLSKYNNIVVINFNENVGIARALNEVLRRCNRHYTHLLTMDQDSRFVEDSMKNYIEYLNQFDWNKTLGVSPKILDDMNAPPYSSDVVFKETKRVITSGNIISVNNAIAIGGFDEELFIDEVDFEFCYRGSLNGYVNYIFFKDVYLKHRLGNPIKIRLMNKTFETMNHNFLRKYYIARNRCYVYKKYKFMDEKFFYKLYIKQNFYMFWQIVFIESDKWRKLRYFVKGIIDFYIGRMGKVY